MIAITRGPSFTDWLMAHMPAHEPIQPEAVKVIGTERGEILAVTSIEPVDGVAGMATAGNRYSRPYLAAVFNQAFRAMGCRRASFLISEDNESALRFCRRLGFRQIGQMPRWYNDGRAAVMMDMLPEECRWVR